jgi:oxygen-independent coproporphyrinogen III oxidase
MEHSLYIHIPFCRHRCHYCDFITTAGQEGLLPAYMNALEKEIRIVISAKENFPIHSIYFGGGTPSLVSVDLLKSVISTIQSNFDLTKDCEINLEANPGTISRTYLQTIHDIGVNRLSLGVQSTDTFDLRRLDRIHTIQDVVNAVRDARSAGFDNINMDLIFGLPWQDMKSWEYSLKRALALKPDHLSLYSLIIEPGTPLYNWYQKGLVAEKDQDLEADMYELAMNLLADAGFTHYEISNWAKNDPRRDYRSRHNLQYWLNQPYFGLGVGAQGYVDHIRTVNTPVLNDYLQRMIGKNEKDFVFPTTPATLSVDKVDQETQMMDEMMLSLRLIQDGVNKKRFLELYKVEMTDTFPTEIMNLIDLGLIEWVGEDREKLRLTRRGIFVANQVFMEFV